MTISVEEVKAFIEDAKKAREDWCKVADKSWSEIKKKKSDNRLWSFSPNSLKKRSRYPIWYSIFKIRQPLIFARIGVPIGRDTTQDGSDGIGATAALCLERLAKNIARDFDFFDALSSVRDDALATNFGEGRIYYECEEVSEKVKEYLTPKQTETGEVVFLDTTGNVVTETEELAQDENGFFFEKDEVVDIKREKVFFEHLPYKNIYLDPDMKRFRRCKRMAFEENYSRPEFIEIFGASALATLPTPNDQGSGEAAPKNRNITVFEYWDDYEKETLWLPKDGKEFIKPKKAIAPEESLEGEDVSGIYNLRCFFPVPEPLMINQPSDEFWPVPEYYQLVDIIEDIHTIFSRMVTCTKAIRARLLFDSNIEGLQAALNEASEGEAIGISNLAQALSGSGGSIEGAVAYVPIEKIVQSLQNLYVALEQRLNSIYKLTGTSDLLQGLITDPTQRTFGERQMLEKYALNQSAELQVKMANFVRNCYQLMCEVALKNFKPASLDQYIMPKTMPPEHAQRYSMALELLKSDSERFRIELETDSTIAINEEYDKAMRVELVNTLTAAIEKVASIAQQSPALLSIELRALKFLIQGMRQAKMFQDEIVGAIDKVVEQTEAQAQNAEPPFDAEKATFQLAQVDSQLKQADFQLRQAELQAKNQLEIEKIASTERIEVAQLQQNERMQAIEAQVEGFKAQVDSQQSQEKLQLEYQRLSADVMKTQADMAAERDRLMIEVQKLADQKEIEGFKLSLEERFASFDAQIKAAQQSLEEQRMVLDQREKYATEARLQAEHELNKLTQQIDFVGKLQETRQAQIPAAPPVTKKIKVVRDQAGNIAEFEELIKS